LPAYSDPNGETVSLSFVSSPSTSFLTLNTGTFTMSPTIADSGVYTITVSLSDGVNSPHNYGFQITVNPNTPPTFSATLTD